jgi:RNA polymerase sigma-70 factor, ECF subfamily
MTHLAVFAQYRSYLLALAKKILGNGLDAEDLLQETFLKWQQTPLGQIGQIRSPKAYLSTILKRLCLNHLQSARVRHEEAVGSAFPEITVPEQQPVSDGVASAFFVLLERLSPKEQLVLLLRDVFDYDYEEIAPIIRKNADNCRQLLSRARQHLLSGKSRFTVSPDKLHALVHQFANCCASGDLNSLVAALA